MKPTGCLKAGQETRKAIRAWSVLKAEQEFRKVFWKWSIFNGTSLGTRIPIFRRAFISDLVTQHFTIAEMQWLWGMLVQCVRQIKGKM